MNIFSNPSDLIYYDNEEDNIIIYSNNLPSFNKDSLISLISIDTNDISFFTYSKVENPINFAALLKMIYLSLHIQKW
jgi:hypothetical protein